MPTVCDELNERFIAYCESLGQAERIDRLILTPNQQKAKRADFFFANRRIICEIKSLETETNDKLVSLLLEAGLKPTPAEFELTRLIEARADRSALYQRCINVITTAVSDGLDDANRQIRETKRTFGIDYADGLVVLLHGRVRGRNPDVIMLRVQQRFQKLNADKSGPALEHVTGVVLFSEIHKLKFVDGTTAAAAIPVRNLAVDERFDVSAFMNMLIEGWADWNGRKKHIIPAAALR